MPTRKRSLLDEIDRARSEAARKIRLALSNLHNLRTGLEQEADIPKDTQLRLIIQAEDALKEVEDF